MSKRILRLICAFYVVSTMGAFSSGGWAMELQVGASAPLFKTKDDRGQAFDLSERKGKWTVLYFYPKADTPGCTKQACAFRDSIKVIRDLGAEIYGVSSDSVEALAKFRDKHHLNFPLLADPDHKIIDSYGTKMPLLPVSKRWTFIVDPQLKIRAIDKDVDPVKDAEKVAERLRAFK